MINQPDLNLSQKPKLIPSLLAGFEAVANHIELIILPIILDLILWFGPHLRIKVLLQPLLEGLKLPSGLQSSELAQIFSATKDISLLADRFNIFSTIRTLPVGIPSLMANISPVTNPLGSPIVLEARNYSSGLMILLVVGLIGLIGSSYYYNSINRITSSDKAQVTPGSIGWQTLQLLYLTIICVIFIVITIFPTVMLVSFLNLISPILGQMALFAGGMILIWIITPMLYTPQVIFMQHQSVLKALLSSIRMVRFALPSSGLFFITVIIIAQGLDLLWQIPKENSWFSLIGIAGHALVNTSLTAAIFVYYRDGIKWIQSIITKNNLSPATASELPKVN
jgi:hypothetical protein